MLPCCQQEGDDLCQWTEAQRYVAPFWIVQVHNSNLLKWMLNIILVHHPLQYCVFKEIFIAENIHKQKNILAMF